MRMPIVPLQNLVILLSSVGVLGLSCRVVNPELIEDDSILDHGTQRAQQPGDRFHNVLGVLRVAEDAQSVGQVARQGKEEEEERKSFAGLLPVVLDDLRNAGAQIAQSTEVSQRHAHDTGNRRRRSGSIRLLRAIPCTDLVRHKPASCTQQIHGSQAQRVVQPSVAVWCLVLAGHDAGEGVAEARLLIPNRGAALRAGDARRRAASQQRLVFGGIGLRRLGALAGGAAGVDGVVVQTLRNEDEIGEAEVCS